MWMLLGNNEVTESSKNVMMILHLVKVTSTDTAIVI